MKKHLTTILSFAMTMLMAFTASFTLTSCGEEVVIDDSPSGKTVFAAGLDDFKNEDGTRTSLDKNLVYYWQYNDQIWVNDGGKWTKSTDSELSSDAKSARFFYDKLMTDDSYEVVYTGYNSQSHDKVTIPATFVTGNYNTNIGFRGDCGVATATKQGGYYSFALQHKAAYLGVAPLKTGYLNKNYIWTKIEITDVNGKPIAGTFGFSHANGMDTTNIASPSSSITLTVSQNGILPPIQSYNSDYDYTYTVIPPCHRELHVKYYFYDTADPGTVMTITKKLNPRKFFENNVVTFRHGLAPDYYRWDAPKSEPFSGQLFNQSAAADFTQATNSCAAMPNPNELAWYALNGDPRWDGETEWTMDDGASMQRGGVWIKKKQYIQGFSSEVSPDGNDRRTMYDRAQSNQTSSYKSSGKPANTSQYFFLPALGTCPANGSGIPEGVGIEGAYWSSYSSAYNPVFNETGYFLNFTSNGIGLQLHRRSHGFIAGKGSDWFK